MKDSRSKKAIAASLSLTLALGSVPAVALADDADQDSKDVATQAATDVQEYVNIHVNVIGGPATASSLDWNAPAGVSPETVYDHFASQLKGYEPDPDGHGTYISGYYKDDKAIGQTDAIQADANLTLYVKKSTEQKPSTDVETVNFKITAHYYNEDGTATVKDDEVIFNDEVEADSSISDYLDESDPEGFTYQGFTATNAGTSVPKTTSVKEAGNLNVYYYQKAEEQPAVETQSLKIIGIFQGGSLDGQETLLDANGVDVRDTFDKYVNEYDGYTIDHMAANAATGDNVNITDAVKGINTLYVYYKADEQPAQDQRVDLTIKGMLDDTGETFDLGEYKGALVGSKIANNVVTRDVDGYELTGEYSTTAAGDPLSGDDVVTEDMKTIYVHYAPVQQIQTVNLRFVAIFQGGELDGTNAEFGSAEGVAVGTKVSQAVPGHAVAGYTPQGYSCAETGLDLDADDEIAEGMETIYVYYKADQQAPEVKTTDLRFVAIFHGGDKDGQMEEFGSAQGVAVGTKVSNIVPGHEVEGYTSDGYACAETGKDLDADDEIAEGMNTIYVHYNANQAPEVKTTDLRFVAIFQGGELDGTNEEFASAKGVAVGTKISDAVPGHDVAGYVFNGYANQVTGADLKADDTVTEDMDTIYVYYKADEMHQHVVNYDFADGSEPRSATYNVSDSQMEKGFTGWLNVYQPQRDGYEFLGWAYKDSDGTILADDTALPNTETVDVVAQWKEVVTPAEKVTVKFVDNFNKTTSSQEIEKGATATQPADPAYDGYTFEGWSSTLEDEQGNPKYTKVDFSQPVNEDTTYYAFYVKNATPQPGDNGNQGATTDSTEATTAADNQATGEQEGTDQSSEAPQTSDATNAAAVAGIGGIAGLLAAAAALLRRRRNN